MMEVLYKVEVSVRTEYLENQSLPSEGKYFFSYTVTIKNVGKIPAKLISRHWVITDANERIEEVRGLGVVGEQPRLKTNESFEYTSGTPLTTSSGFMEGSYEMQCDDGNTFNVQIPQFSLDTPFENNKLN